MGHTSMEWFLTHHARDRIAAMGVEVEDVIKAASDPVAEYPGKTGPNTRRVRVRHPLAVVVDTANNAILTVMWDQREGRHSITSARALTADVLASAEGEPSDLLVKAWALVHAQGRMLDGWAEGDDAAKRQLWRDLHRKGDELREALEADDPS